jgi:hypothetical protein
MLLENSQQEHCEDILSNPHIYNRFSIGTAKIGDFLIGIDIPPIVVINLRTRGDRAKMVIETMGNQTPPLPFIFYTAEPHNNPVRGCLESHINIVKWAKNRGCRAVCIFEDDFVIQHTLSSVPPFPQDWDMVYLGGLCTHIKSWSDEIPQTPSHQFVGNKWVKGTFYCDHSYLVKNSVFDKIIDEGWAYTKELDRFYTGEIHDSPIYNVYMSYVQYVIQYPDWSDIDNKDKWKNFRWPNPGEMFNVP